MRGTEGNYVIFVFISFRFERKGNEYNDFACLHKNETLSGGGSSRQRKSRDDATHIIFIMRIDDNRPFHLRQATDEISKYFY